MGLFLSSMLHHDPARERFPQEFSVEFVRRMFKHDFYPPSSWESTVGVKCHIYIWLIRFKLYSLLHCHPELRSGRRVGLQFTRVLIFRCEPIFYRVFICIFCLWPSYLFVRMSQIEQSLKNVCYTVWFF